jgi:hypothetical protein
VLPGGNISSAEVDPFSSLPLIALRRMRSNSCTDVAVQISKVHAAWIEVVRDSFDGSVRGVGDDRIRCNAVE